MAEWLLITVQVVELAYRCAFATLEFMVLSTLFVLLCALAYRQLTGGKTPL